MSINNSGFTLAAPPIAPTIATGSSSGSLNLAQAYKYKITFLTAFGETVGGPEAVLPSTSTGSILLTNIPISINGLVTSRRIYRTRGRGNIYYSLDEIFDNITTTYLDRASDFSLSGGIPTINSAHSLQTFAGNIKINKPLILSVEKAITATGAVIANAYQLTQEFNICSTVAASTGVRLPGLNSSLIGMHIRVRNNGANSLKIYPFTSQTINNGATNAAVNLANGLSIDLIADSATNWSPV